MLPKTPWQRAAPSTDWFPELSRRVRHWLPRITVDSTSRAGEVVFDLTNFWPAKRTIGHC